MGVETVPKLFRDRGQLWQGREATKRIQVGQGFRADSSLSCHGDGTGACVYYYHTRSPVSLILSHLHHIAM